MPYFDYQARQIFYSENGTGKPLLLLHGNTASSRLFSQVIPLFDNEYRVITLDFLGNGLSDRIPTWPEDLWFTCGEQAETLCNHLSLEEVYVIGTSGGALAALNLALEHPQRVAALICDSFEGLKADPKTTESIAAGREYAQQMEGFCSMLQAMHGDDWKQVIDADTDALVRHARNVVDFCHQPLSQLKAPLLLTGSAEDEMFPQGHYELLFEEIARYGESIQKHIFPKGNHPAMLSNAAEFTQLAKSFFGEASAR